MWILNKQQISEEATRKIRKYFDTNKYTTYQNLEGEIWIENIYIMRLKEGRSHISSPSSCLKTLKSRSETNGTEEIEMKLELQMAVAETGAGSLSDLRPDQSQLNNQGKRNRFSVEGMSKGDRQFCGTCKTKKENGIL